MNTWLIENLNMARNQFPKHWKLVVGLLFFVVGLVGQMGIWSAMIILGTLLIVWYFRSSNE